MEKNKISMEFFRETGSSFMIDECIDSTIDLVEKSITDIFDRYSNDDFENLMPAAFVFKNTIRFVPIELKDKMQELVDLYEILIDKKKNISNIKRLKKLP